MKIYIIIIHQDASLVHTGTLNLSLIPTVVYKISFYFFIISNFCFIIYNSKLFWQVKQIIHFQMKQTFHFITKNKTLVKPN